MNFRLRSSRDSLAGICQGHAIVAVLLGVASLAIAAFADAAPLEKPNILFFLADDLGWGDTLAYNPDSKISMPNLEQLAAQGMRFMDAHTAAAKCAPTRYTTITGNYQWRGLRQYGQWNWKGGSQVLNGQWTLGDVLSQQGYNTAFIGKLHLGGDWYRIGSNDFVAGSEPDEEVDFSRPFVNGPLDYGFHYSFLAPYGIQSRPYAYFENDLLVGDSTELINWEPGQYGDSVIQYPGGIGMPYWDSSQVGPDLASNAIAFIDRHHQQNLAQGTNDPFFLYYSSQSAHSPYTPPATFLGEPVRGVTGLSDHADMIYEIDVALGKLTDALIQRGLADNTLVIVTSDNGGNGNDLPFGHDATGVLRGWKGQIWEGGHRVPLVVKWGDGSPAGSIIPPNTTSNQLIGVHDLMATIAALVGGTLPADQARDSFNFLPVFLGTIGDESPVRDHIIMEADNLDGVAGRRHYAYREGSWKLVFDNNQNVKGLYNLATDLAETIDLKNDPNEAGRVASMVSNFQSLRAAARTAPVLDTVDTDLDGLADNVETSPGIGTDPWDADSDDDGLTDGFEVNYNSPPADTYSPGLDTDPLNPDTDNDGFLDGMELASGHDPLVGSDSPVWGDTDGNGILNAGDVMLLVQAVLGLTTLADDQKARVDIAPVIAGTPSPDKQVTLGDLLVVEQMLLGLASYP